MSFGEVEYMYVFMIFTHEKDTIYTFSHSEFSAYWRD